MQKFAGRVCDAKGGPIGQVTITVNVAGGSAATIYSDNGVTAKANPFVNNPNGTFEFYAADGRYDVVPTKTGMTLTSLLDLALSDPAGPFTKRLSVQGGDSGTPASTTETTLKSFVVPGGTLAQNDDMLRFSATFRTAGNANTKRIRVKFGATTLSDSTAIAFNDSALYVEGVIVRTAAATQRAVVVAQAGANGGGWLDTYRTGQATTAPAETLSGDVTLAITGQNGSAVANDLICDSLIVELLAKTP